ncbi:Clp protease N-terminal domain-containing protein, partial [Faecalicatena contorta]
MQINYTNQAECAIKYAASMAKKLKHPYIGTEHLLLGLRKEFTGVAGQILASNSVDEERI